MRWLQTVLPRVHQLCLVCVPSTSADTVRAALQAAVELEAAAPVARRNRGRAHPTLHLYCVGCGASAAFFEVLLDLQSVRLRRLRVDATGNFIHSADPLCAGFANRPALEDVEIRLAANPLDPTATLALVARAAGRCPRLRSVVLSLPGAPPPRCPVGPPQVMRAMPHGLRRLHVEFASGGPADIVPVARSGSAPLRELTVAHTDALGLRQSCVEASMLAASLPAA
jgi:hypothetical protein